MEYLVRMGLLYDFYGVLLTRKQQRVFTCYYMNNLSLAEIAAEEGTSRQAVHDLLQRTEKILERWEDKLQLMNKYSLEKEAIREVESELKSLMDTLPNDTEMNKAFSSLQKSFAKLKSIVLE